jgi:chloride channel 3/4/5
MPLTVSSKLPLEVVMQLFKRMGYVHSVSLTGLHSHYPPPPLSSPRVILVEDFGMLVGLTTVKDVLHLEPHEQLNSPIIAWSHRGALDGALEELWTWLADMRSSVNAWYSRISGRRR